jgi:cysteine desulfurase
MNRVKALRDRLEEGVLRATPEARIMAGKAERLANTSCIAWPGKRAETLVIKLDLAGIAVSAGAACSSGKVGQSHVLAAMGLSPEIASSAIRVSIGAATTEKDIAAFLTAWQSIRGDTQIAA